MKGPNKKYSIKAYYLPTKRIRTIIQVGVNADACCQTLREQGYTDPFEATEIIDDPTEAQMNYAVDLGIAIPPNATKQDVSVLIDFKLENDTVPKPGLVQFANEEGLYFSQYIGESALYNLIFNSLDHQSRVAFFIFSIHRWLVKGGVDNLNESPHKQHYLDFASENQDNDRLSKSINRYNGADLRDFGNVSLGGGEYYQGASKDTIAFKTAHQYLKSHGLVRIEPERAPVVKKNPVYQSQKRQTIAEVQREMNKGCLLSAVVLTMTGFLLFCIVSCAAN
ncbi:hypothetical protein GCM10007423_63240 [Dyadobacter endophyticus]|uniref:Uncharacterized protein n=1 Tax=Dyadobacter endophyticus TaxID=1749036 RepID=A0ABQ1ZAH1_9BACT|nr:hypothetical protein [Dyadobacter endophyticus]GGH55570.1 hypothetical protein GCM10007423_63240 [Dyadobacter endophyticus]